MFYFDPVNDIDLDSYAYQLYDIPNPTSLTAPIASGPKMIINIHPQRGSERTSLSSRCAQSINP